MPPKSSSKPTRRKSKSGATPWKLWLALLVILGGASWVYLKHRATWNTGTRIAAHPLDWLNGKGAPAEPGPPVTAAPAPAPAPAATAANTLTTLPPLPPPPPGACGDGRLAVKDLTDPDAHSIDPGHAVDATIAQLAQLPRPADVDAHPGQRSSAEHRVYRVSGTLVRYDLQPGSDDRLVLADPANPRLELSALIPSGKCSSNQDYSALFDELQQDIHLRFGPVTAAGAAVAHPPAVTIIGVGFFGPAHDPVGLPANGFQLHPVLDFKVN